MAQFVATTTEEAIQAFTTLATSLDEAVLELKAAHATLQSSYETNKEGLGYHSESIQNLLDELVAIEEDATNPVKKLVLKLTRAAAVRCRNKEKNVYGGKSR